MFYEFENIIFWSSFYWSIFSPIVNLLVAIGFNTVVAREIFCTVKEKINSMNEKWYTPTE